VQPLIGLQHYTSHKYQYKNMNEFEIIGKSMQSMMKVMKSSLAMMTQMKLKTEHNKIVLGEFYKKPKRWLKNKH